MSQTRYRVIQWPSGQGKGRVSDLGSGATGRGAQAWPCLGLGRGFTLVELLVAISIVVVMLFLMNQVFFSTSQAVGQGVGLSHVLDDSRAMMQQFARDAALMIGPDGKLIDGTPSGSSQGGVLIILQKRVQATVPDRFSGEKRRYVRSDQLVFIRPGDGENPLSPSLPNNYTNTNSAPFVRVWYGHGRRTAANGTDDDMDPATPDDLTRALNANHLGAPMGRNELASKWILCRQALQMIPSPITDIHFNGGWVRCGENSSGTGSLAGYGMSLPNAIRPMMYMGLTDVAYFAYEGDSAHGGMVGGRENDFPSWHSPLYRLWAEDGTNDAEYVRRAVLNYTYGRKQLRVNPKPTFAAGDPQRDYAAWQVAQMHPYMMAGVSDFIVEFAGDYYGATGTSGDPDGNIDVEPNTPIAGTDANGLDYQYPRGNIIWYTHRLFANEPGIMGNSFDSTKPVTYRFPTTYPGYDMNPKGWPGPDSAPHADAAFVFRHDDEAIDRNGDNVIDARDCRWPYLIRLRWRMHDPTNRLWDPADGEAGKWFEQIIAVPRPR